MPVNRKYDIATLIDAAKYYFKRTGRRVIFEYTLIAGVNDTPACAEKLASLTRGFPSHVNLIRLNPTDASLRRPTEDAAKTFLTRLSALGVSATIRHSFGEDVEGACGQLRRRVIAESGKCGDGEGGGTHEERKRKGSKFTTA